MRNSQNKTKVIQKSTDKISMNKQSETLHHACSIGDYSKALLLIKAGADANSRDDDDYSALSYATIHGHKDIAKLLIDNGAEPCSQAIKKAIFDDDPELLNRIIEAPGFDPSFFEDIQFLNMFLSKEILYIGLAFYTKKSFLSTPNLEEDILEWGTDYFKKPTLIENMNKAFGNNKE